MKYSVDAIRGLIETAARQELAHRELLLGFTAVELAEICNGIGPAAFPDWLSGTVTHLHPTLEATAMIHDVEFYLSDGLRATFFDVNARFCRNGCRAAKWAFSWYDPRRYHVMLNARRFAWLCDSFGWNGWCSCGNNNELR